MVKKTFLSNTWISLKMDVAEADRAKEAKC